MSRSATAEPTPRSAGGSSRGPALAVAGLFAVLLGACGGSGSAAPATATPASVAATDAVATDAAATDDTALPVAIDACSLVTQQEAEALAQAKLQPPVGSGEGNDQCMWTAPPTDSVGQVQVNIGDGAKKQYDIDNEVLKHDFRPVPGLGDEAYVEDGDVFVRVGLTWISIGLVSLSVEDSKPGLIALAKVVVTRVPSS